MGWTAFDDLDHINNVVNRELANVKAESAEFVKASVDELVNDRTGVADPARCWYLAPTADGTKYIGVILLDIDRELSRKLKTQPGSVYIINREQRARNDDPYVQVWMTKTECLAEGNKHSDYPERFSPYAGN